MKKNTKEFFKKHTKRIIYHGYFWQLLFTLIPTALLIYVPMQFSFLDPVTIALENFSLTDLYQKFMINENLRKSNEIYVLDITHVKGRGNIAEVIRELDKVNPKVMGLDILFRQYSDSLSEEDLVLKQTINKLNNTLIYGYRFVSDDGGTDYSYFMPEDHKNLYAGYTNTTIANKHAELLRTFTLSMKMQDSIYDSFIFKIAKLYNPSVKRTTKALNTNYTNTSITVVSPHEISSLLSGKIVLIGLASGYEDLFHTPVGDLPGVVVQAYSIHNLLHDNYIKEVHWIISLFFSLLICIFAIWINNLCQTKFKNIPDFVFNCFLWIYLIVLAFMNIIICFYFKISLPFTIAFISFFFIGVAYELQSAIFYRKKINT